MSALDAWKKRTAREVELPSGTHVGVELVTTRDLLLAGAFPAEVIPLVREMESGGSKDEAPLTDERLEAFNRFQRILIGRTVKTVEGEPVTLTEDDVAALPQDDKDDLYLYAMRLRPLPKATDSPSSI
jgi:hypothetical protein